MSGRHFSIRPVSLAFAIAVIALASGGCFSWESPEPISVQLAEDGGLIIHYDRCEATEEIRQVTLLSPGNFNESTGRYARNETLWEIKSLGDPSITTIAINDPPASFNIAVEAPQVLPAEPMQVYVQFYNPAIDYKAVHWTEFSLSDLRPGEVRSKSRSESVDEFFARESCQAGRPKSTPAMQGLQIALIGTYGLFVAGSFTTMGVMLTKEFRRIRRSR